MSVHLTPELLGSFQRGQLSRWELLDLIFDHTPEVCPHCREGFAALQEDPVPPDPVVQFAVWYGLLVRFGPEIAAAEERARRDVAELRRLPPMARRGRIERAYRRFRGAAFVHAMLGEARSHLHSEPTEAYHWAELAWVAAYESPRLPADSVALVRAEMANALRVCGNLSAADKIFEHVRHLVDHGPVSDLQAVAQITRLEGALRKDQRRFQPARKLLERSIWLCDLIGDDEGSVRALMTLADALFYQGRSEAAIEKIRQALQKLPERPSKLRLWARHNLACYLAACGQHAEAARLRKDDELLTSEAFEAVDRIRLTWLDGLIAASGGDLQQAVEKLSRVTNRFQKRELAYPAALGARDLVLALGRLGRRREAEALAPQVAQAILSCGADSRALEPMRPYLRDLPEGLSSSP